MFTSKGGGGEGEGGVPEWKQVRLVQSQSQGGPGGRGGEEGGRRREEGGRKEEGPPQAGLCVV